MKPIEIVSLVIPNKEALAFSIVTLAIGWFAHGLQQAHSGQVKVTDFNQSMSIILCNGLDTQLAVAKEKERLLRKESTDSVSSQILLEQSQNSIKNIESKRSAFKCDITLENIVLSN